VFKGSHLAVGSWYSQDCGTTGVKPTKDAYSTVEVIRVPAGVLTGSFSVRVTTASIAEDTVPGLDGGADNQDFALSVSNACVNN
jgi:hypothetical protein